MFSGNAVDGIKKEPFLYSKVVQSKCVAYNVRVNLHYVEELIKRLNHVKVGQESYMTYSGEELYK